MPAEKIVHNYKQNISVLKAEKAESVNQKVKTVAGTQTDVEKEICATPSQSVSPKEEAGPGTTESSEKGNISKVERSKEAAVGTQSSVHKKECTATFSTAPQRVSSKEEIRTAETVETSVKAVGTQDDVQEKECTATLSAPPQFVSSQEEIRTGTPESSENDNTSTTERREEKGTIYRLLLIGKTGSGKSSSGNTILGRKAFATSYKVESKTKECQLERIRLPDKEIEVMDAPGFFDTKKSNDEIAELIIQALACMNPGPHGILYVLPIGGRYTNEEFETYAKIKRYFGEEVVNFIILLFSHGDTLTEEPEETSEDDPFEDYIQSAIADSNIFQTLLQECGNRRIAFNNKATKSEKDTEVSNLLTIVQSMLDENGDRHFQCHLSEGVNQEMKRLEENKIAERMSPDAETVQEDTKQQEREEPKIEKGGLPEEEKPKQPKKHPNLEVAQAAYRRHKDNMQRQKLEAELEEQRIRQAEVASGKLHYEAVGIKVDSALARADAVWAAKQQIAKNPATVRSWGIFMVSALGRKTRGTYKSTPNMPQ